MGIGRRDGVYGRMDRGKLIVLTDQVGKGIWRRRYGQLIINWTTK